MPRRRDIVDEHAFAGGRDAGAERSDERVGSDWVFQQHATDPRLDGTLAIKINVDLRPDGSAEMWGTWELTHAGGTWAGPWTGTIAPGKTTHCLLGSGNGSGGHAGLAWHWQGRFIEGSEGFTPDVEVVTTGWIEPAS